MTTTPKRLAIRELSPEDRPRYRASRVGTENLSNAELLSLITSFTYADTASTLLSTAGTLERLAGMTLEEMGQVPDVGPAAATAIKAALELGRRLNRETSDTHTVHSPSDAAPILMNLIGSEERECLAVMLLNTKHAIIGTQVVYRGTLNSANVRLAEVFQPAIRRNASGIVIAHNHPSGDVTPSPEDVQVTRDAVQSGKLLGIDVVDHLIVSPTRYASLRERGHGF